MKRKHKKPDICTGCAWRNGDAPCLLPSCFKLNVAYETKKEVCKQKVKTQMKKISQ